MSQYTNGVLSTTVSGPATSYIAVQDHSLPTNPEVTGSNGGGLYRRNNSLTGMDIIGAFTSGSIAAILDRIGISGQCVGTGHAITAGGMIARRIGDCDNPLGGTPHFQVLAAKGLLALGELNIPADGDASITGALYTYSASGGSPVAITDGVAWPSTIIEERFRYGVSKFAGVEFDEIENISLAFNVSMLPKTPHPGTIFRKTGGVLAVDPILTLRGQNLAKVKTALIEITGNGATAINTLLQLVKIQDGASFVNAATSEHISMQLTGLMVPSNLLNASAGNRATNEIVLTTNSVSGAAPIIIDTTSPYDSTP